MYQPGDSDEIREAQQLEVRICNGDTNAIVKNAKPNAIQSRHALISSRIDIHDLFPPLVEEPARS